jgi:membrane associated rhomboid family serine protease
VVALVAFFLIQFPLSVLGQTGLFALTPLFPLEPWTLVTSVYSHAGPSHLIGNLLPLVVFGLLVERVTTRLRYHLFFLTTGALSGLSQITLGAFAGSVAVLGASGAVFALAGYAVTGNVVVVRLLGGLDRLTGAPWASTLVLALVAVAVAVALSGPNSAVIAHLTGLSLGLVAGRARLLHVKRRRNRTRSTRMPGR